MEVCSPDVTCRRQIRGTDERPATLAADDTFMPTVYLYDALPRAGQSERVVDRREDLVAKSVTLTEH